VRPVGPSAQVETTRSADNNRIVRETPGAPLLGSVGGRWRLAIAARVDGDFMALGETRVVALQFYALHKELVDSGKMTNRAFHDAIYREGNMPVEMVRAGLSDEQLTPDSYLKWKFWKP
jgi:hypothetical protein